MPLIFSSSPNLDYFIFPHTLNPQDLEFRYKRLYFNIYMLIFQIEYQRFQYLKIQSLKDWYLATFPLSHWKFSIIILFILIVSILQHNIQLINYKAPKNQTL